MERGRQDELDEVLGTLTDPDRSVLAAARVSQGNGKLDVAAGVVRARVKGRPGLRYFAVLMALEAAELRQAGAVRYTTPPPHPGDRIGTFWTTVWPQDVGARLDLAPAIDESKGATVVFVLTWKPRVESQRTSEALQAAIAVLRDALEDHLGFVVRVR